MSYQDDLPPNVELTTQHTVHRSASKAYSRPPDEPSSKRAMQGAYAVAAVALVAVAVFAAMFFTSKSATGTAITQLRQQLATVNSELADARTANASQVDGLAGKVSTISGALNALAQFNTVCSQYLTGPSGGPTTFYFPCTDQKP
jgi:hypothetical protein